MIARILAAVLAGATMLSAAAAIAQAPSQPPSGQASSGPASSGQDALRSRTMHQGELVPKTNPHAFKKPQRGEARMPNAVVVRGTSAIAAAWFSEPSNRYRHMPFGGDQHPTAVTVSTSERRLVKLTLPKDSVFEDRLPRIVDLDGDGKEEIVTIRAYAYKGAALAVLALRNNTLEIAAETPPIGTPFRWLNPVGFADFDGDGRLDIAYVETPHIQGKLKIWSFRDGTLEQMAEIDDVSNHVYGSMHQKLAVIADFNGDGRPDIAIPSQSRTSLRFLTLKNGEIEELGDTRLPAPAAEDFELVTVAGKPAVRVGLSGGRSRVIAPCRDVQDWEMVEGAC